MTGNHVLDAPPVGDVVDRGAVESIVSAANGNPFAVLGPHQVSPGVWDVRVFVPWGEEVELLGYHDDAPLAPFQTVHPAGFRVARVESDERPGYRVRVTQDKFGHVFHDPYSFGSALADYDIAAITHSNDTVFYYIFGAHPIRHGKLPGLRFVVWAPSARNVSVIGDFNAWDGRRHPMRCHLGVGVWELFVPELECGCRYKFEIKGHHGEIVPQKADPVAFAAEHPPHTASVAHGLPPYQWSDADWLAKRAAGDDRNKPVAIYECHLGSWRRKMEENNRVLTYRELADTLVGYVKDMGFTHIEMLPITEFPYDGSWGYQPVSLFAPTSRFGTPEDFAFFVDRAHQAGIGLILDWVPAHFPNDAHGLASFDGTHLYEHADPRQGFHQDWGTYIYNYGRREVQAFLIANARFWLDQYHLDGLRVDAVASMLYLDYSRKSNEWVPNQYGGNENLEAIGFLRKMNEIAYQAAPGVMTVAEESTSWPGVSQPTYNGGLGFGFKWNMGWMHDTLHYIQEDPVHRSYHHSNMTFGLVYAFSENFILPISHDEVVHGKGSLLGRMPGDEWQRFANLRAYLGFMYAHPGKKLLFMGCEFGQEREWNYNHSLDWHLLDNPNHKGVQNLVRDLNGIYAGCPALHERDCEGSGFRWLVGDDVANSVFAFARFGEHDGIAVAVCNFTPVPRTNYRVGVPRSGHYKEAINTDAQGYAGSNLGNYGGVSSEEVPCHGEAQSVVVTLPPLATVIFTCGS